jgi:hypothetical protein
MVGTLIMEHPGAAALFLGVIVFLIAFAIAPSGAARALVVAIATLACCVVIGYNAASNEFTGTAVYHVHKERRSTPVWVTRRSDPEKFREATNMLWAVSGFFLVISAISFKFHRSLNE